MNTRLFRQASFLIILIIVSGLFIRIHHLGEESLWLDEGHSIRMAKLPVSQMVEEIAANKHPPVYFLALHGWISIFGDSEFSVRALSAIFGVLAIALLYQVASLLFDRTTSLLAALLLALSSFNLFYSQETRMYSLLTFLSLGSMYYFIKWLSGGKKWASVGYLVFSTLLIYTQNFGFFIILAQNIYLAGLLLHPRSRSGTPLKSWIILQSLLILFYLPWMGILIKQILTMDSGSWSVPRPSWKGLLYSFKCFSGSFWLLGISLPLAFYGVFPHPAGGDRGREDVVSARVITDRDSERICFLSIWLLSLVLIPFLISQFGSSIYVHRATVLATLPWYILVARGINRIRFRYLRLVIVIVIIGFSLFSIKEYFIKDQKDQWREAIDYIDTYTRKGDLIYLYGNSPYENVFSYYYKRCGLPDKSITVSVMPITGLSDDELAAVAKEFDRVWMILSHVNNNEIERVRKVWEEDYYLVRNKRYFNYSQDQFHRDRVGLIVFLFFRKDHGEEVEGGSLRNLLASLRSHPSWNLVKNPGFEGGGAGWTERASAFLAKDNAFSGTNAARVDKVAFPSANFYHLRQRLTVPRRREYIFGAYIKTRGLAGDITVELKELEGDRFHQYYPANRISGNNGWTLLLGSFEPGPGDDPVRIEIRPGRIFDFQKGEFRVDDAFLVPASRFPGD